MQVSCKHCSNKCICELRGVILLDLEANCLPVIRLKKCFPLDFQIVADLIDLFSPLNFIAKLKQWPLTSELCGEDFGSWVHTPKSEVQSCFISALVTFLSITSYFLKERASWHLVWWNSRWPRATGYVAHIKGRVCLLFLIPFARRMHFPDKWNLGTSLPSNLHERIRQRAYKDHEGSCAIHLESQSSYRAPRR